MKNILLTTPSLKDKGGVASFINSVLPYILEQYETNCFELGSTHNSGKLIHPIADQLVFNNALKKDKFRLVHVNPSLNIKSFFRDGLIVLQAKRASIPVLVFWHGWNKDFEKIVEKNLLWFFKKTFGKADGVIVLASEFEEKLKSWGIKNPIYRISTTIDERLLTNVDIELKISGLENKLETGILFLSRLEKSKGVFETIDAVNILIKKGLKVKLSIAGDGPVFQDMKKYISDLGLKENQIEVLGYVQNNQKIEAFYSNDIYCFPTFYGEGLPTSVLEAMAFAMPIVTRSIGGIADFFEDGNMGQLVKGTSPEEIAQCLEHIINDKIEMTRVARYNANYAKQNFMASVVSKTLLDIYNDIVISSGGHLKYSTVSL